MDLLFVLAALLFTACFGGCALNMPSITECKKEFKDCFPCYGWGDMDPVRKCPKHPKDGDWKPIEANANCAVDRDRFFQVCCSTAPEGGSCGIGSSPIHIAGPKAQRCADWKWYHSDLDCTRQPPVEGKAWEYIPENTGCATTKAMFVTSCCRVSGSAFGGMSLKTGHEREQNALLKAKQEEAERHMQEEARQKEAAREEAAKKSSCSWLRFKTGMACPPQKEYNFKSDAVQVPKVSPQAAFQKKFEETCCQDKVAPSAPDALATCESLVNNGGPVTSCSSIGRTYDRKCYGSKTTTTENFLNDCCQGGKSCAGWMSSGKSCVRENMYDNPRMNTDPLACAAEQFRKVCCLNDDPADPKGPIVKYECCNGSPKKKYRLDVEVALANLQEEQSRAESGANSIIEEKTDVEEKTQTEDTSAIPLLVFGFVFTLLVLLLLHVAASLAYNTTGSGYDPLLSEEI